MNTLFLNEYRCKCGKLLLKSIFFDGFLEIKCRHCGEINKIGRFKKENDKKNYLLIVNDQGKIVNASDSACLILGYKGEELIGKHFTQINTTIPKEMEKVFIGPDSILNEENYFQIDTFHQTKNGFKVPVKVLLKVFYPKEKEKCILVLSEVKDEIKEKMQNNNQFSSFLDNACDFYFEIDKNGMGEYISPSVEKLFGFTQEKIIGTNYFDLVPAEFREESKKMFNYFSALKQPYKVAHDTGIDANGKIIHNELYFTPNFNNSGEFVGYRVLGWVKK